MLHVHEMMRKGWKYFLATRIARAALSEVVAVSRASAAAMAVSGWAPQIVHEGAPIPAAQLSLRPQPKPFRVGTVGVISRRKGTDLFVEAAQRLPVADGEYEFHLIGAPTDELERDWAVEVLDRAVNAGVLYRESADVSQALRSWDAFVLPSRSDPFPIVMLEAMAAGLPAIGARRDGLEEQLEGGAGLLVEPESATALAARGRQRACTFSLERQAEGLAAAYSTALKNHPEMRS